MPMCTITGHQIRTTDAKDPSQGVQIYTNVIQNVLSVVMLMNPVLVTTILLPLSEPIQKKSAFQSYLLSSFFIRTYDDILTLNDWMAEKNWTGRGVRVLLIFLFFLDAQVKHTRYPHVPGEF